MEKIETFFFLKTFIFTEDFIQFRNKFVIRKSTSYKTTIYSDKIRNPLDV